MVSETVVHIPLPVRHAILTDVTLIKDEDKKRIKTLKR
jgi:hypothetical protein